MNKHYQNAAQRLHKFAAEETGCTETELRAELEAQGVSTDAFLARLGHEAGVKLATVAAKTPTTSERLRVIANRAGDKVKSLLNGLNSDDVADMPSAAYGRSGHLNKKTRASSRGKRGGKNNG